MKPRSPRELIEKARRVYRESAPEEFPLPPGLADRAVNRLTVPSPRKLALWEKVSYGGVAVAACLTLAAWLSTMDREMEPAAHAADLWLDMPMKKFF